VCPRAKVTITIDSLYEVVYEKSIVLHLRLNFSETVRYIEACFQRTTNRKWPMWYHMVTLPMTSRDLER